jgi:hypothetical protein
MAYSYTTYTGNGSTTQFTVPFGYIRKEHVFVEVNDVNTSFTWVNATTVSVSPAPANGAEVVVKRVTPISSRLVDYTDGSTLVAADLDTDSLQHLYTEQELTDSIGPLSNLRALYYGAYSTDPGVDPFGQALDQGDLYYNTQTKVIRVWNGTNWNDANVATLYVRWKKTAVGGETTLSAGDDTSQVLTYTPGYEQVYLNGALLTRGVDYTATNGSSITGLVALTAGDIVEVLGLNNVTVGSVSNGSILTANLADGAVTNAKVNVSAAIAASKLSFTQAGTGAVARTIDSKLKDFVSVKDFGAVGDGTTNDAAAIQTAINYSIANGKALYMPEGTYLISGGDAGLTYSRIEPTITNNSSIFIYGAGPGKTIIKERSGSTLQYGKFHKMLYFNVPASTTVNSLIVKDITFDKNGASNGAEPSAYAWEQAHMLDVAVNATGQIRYLLFDNIELLDKVAGGIVLAAGPIGTAIIRNCHGRNFSNLFSQRGDFEFQASVENLAIINCSGPYAQSEPTVLPPAGVNPIAVIRDCIINSLQFTGYGDSAAAVIRQTIIIDNCFASEKLTMRNGKLLARNSKFVVSSDNSGYWARLAPGSLVDSCTIINKYDAGTDSIGSFYPRSETTFGGFYLDIRNCQFIPGEGASGTTTGSAVANGAAYDGTQPYLVRFYDCTFSPLYQQTINAYRNGIYEMIRCKMAGWGDQAISTGGETTRYGKITIDSCNFSAVTATRKIYVTNANTLWELRWHGSHKYSEFSIAWSSATNIDLYVKHDGMFVADTAPTAGAVKGMVVRVSSPTAGTGHQYIATTNSTTASIWRPNQQFGVSRNTTANRPTLTASDVGILYLDNTLDADGKPIWWNGTAWVDATGATV